ncbi:hypothetical protein [Lysinibacillus piscis]|uniref:YtzI protein n=1 Tax=Lysinibacillus piscis TaxID=2518931 RepID=A0ABQ5NML0_9BACI|nr:hypothetical protein [Lysinibacillus sp. KH24]GLC89480.1 hypothetical protein LYSBPC_26070 [Lysinibacillus sp. KH24]
MSGKKMVIIVIVSLIVACLFAVITITTFYKNHQEQPNRENWEINKSKSLNFVSPHTTIILNSR